jgi:hypothetical protein
MKARFILAVLLIAMTTTGSDCINDGFLVSVNVEGLNGTYAINPGNNTSFNGSVTIAASSYLNTDFGSYENVRVYDVKVHTLGTYSGTANGTLEVNGVSAIGFSGSWAQFSTPQSLLTSPLITRYPGGITTLVNAVLNSQDVTLHGFGTVSTAPVPSGLSVVIEIFAQVDAQP